MGVRTLPAESSMFSVPEPPIVVVLLISAAFQVSKEYDIDPSNDARPPSWLYQ